MHFRSKASTLLRLNRITVLDVGIYVIFLVLKFLFGFSHYTHNHLNAFKETLNIIILKYKGDSCIMNV